MRNFSRTLTVQQNTVHCWDYLKITIFLFRYWVSVWCRSKSAQHQDGFTPYLTPASAGVFFLRNFQQGFEPSHLQHKAESKILLLSGNADYDSWSDACRGGFKETSYAQTQNRHHLSNHGRLCDSHSDCLANNVSKYLPPLRRGQLLRT